MQVKLVITTIAFMLTMIIFGYAALREPARMETFTDAFEARRIEFGGTIYHGNCATCHGEEGKAELCYGPEGDQIACAGLALNNRALLCGEKSERMEILGWAGTKQSFIEGTVATGRVWNGMPTWGSDFGGPLEPYEVGYVAAYVMNWEKGELCEGEPEPPPDWPDTAAELPEGDAAAGEQLYSLTYGCAACHGNLEDDTSNSVGPWVGNFQNLDNVRIDGYSAADYMYESVLLPSDYISPECPTGPCAGPPSGMPDNFGRRLSFQDMADIMAYVNISTADSNGVEVIYPAE
ncbi:MAG: c-type cytochrome [Anaerolineae bacterium]